MVYIKAVCPVTPYTLTWIIGDGIIAGQWEIPSRPNHGRSFQNIRMLQMAGVFQIFRMLQSLTLSGPDNAPTPGFRTLHIQRGR